MEESVISPWQSFLDFDQKMHGRNMNFRVIGKKEFRDDFNRLDLKAPRKITGREVGYIFSVKNGYTVKVWTTILAEQKKPRDKGTDVGWVVIVKGDRLEYCARYFTRPKDENYEKFFSRLLSYAWICREKILNVPKCTHLDCKELMQIYRKRNTRQYFFRCTNQDVHKDPTFESWDYAIKGKPKAMAFVEVRRKRTAQYKKMNRKKGLNPTPKAINRKVWNNK